MQKEEVFRRLRQLQKVISQQDAFMGFSALWKYLPTKANLEIGNLEDVINKQSGSASNDLVHAIIDGAHKAPNHDGEDFIVGNCKTIYFAGHESTAVTAIWCLMLLAKHPEWQERTRAEALDVCHGRTTLDVDALCRLKIVTMVIQETLRLYPPASLMIREALTDIRISDLDVPRGTII